MDTTLEALPADLLVRLAASLAAAEAGDKAAWLAAHAADAPILAARQVVPRHAVTAEMLSPDDLPDVVGIRAVRLDRLELDRWQPEGDERGVAWFRAREIGDDRPVWLAVGFDREAEVGWLIGWAMVAREPADWSYREGKVRTLGEFTLGVRAIPGVSWLDVSYHRAHALPRPPLLTLPGAQFGCQGSTVCCKIDYKIELPRAAQALIDAMPWEELHAPLAGTQLPDAGGGKLLLKGQDEACRFLNEQNQCRIHAWLGRQPFGPCSAFPFHFTETPDGMAVSSSFLCGSVRGNLGPPLEARADDLYERLSMSHQPQPEAYRIGGEQDVPWETYRAAERALLEALGRTDLPLHRRLWIGTRLLDLAIASEPLVVDPAWETEDLDPLSEDGTAGVQSLLLPLLVPRGHSAFADLDPGLPWPEVAHELGPDREIMAGLASNVIFSKVYADPPLTLTTALNVAILCYLAGLNVQALTGQPRLSAATWQHFAIQAMHGRIFQVLSPSLLRTPGFGRWVLRYPLTNSGR